MITIQQIAEKINGKTIGDANYLIEFPAPIETAKDNEITFLANEKYLSFLQNTKAGCVVISEKLYQPNNKINFIIVPNAYEILPIIFDLFAKKNTTIFEKKFIKNIAKSTLIYPNVFVDDNVSIGENCIIYPNVTILQNTIIGNNCIIHSGAVIGGDGFGFALQNDGCYKKIPHLGNVIIEDDVEIGANTCIDRATVGSTIIRKGVKLDNLIQVAHNVEIGEHTVIAAQTGISGSTKIGHHNMVGGQVGFAGHLAIAPNTKINAQSGIASNIKEENTAVSGSPAFDIKKWFKSSVVFKNLAELEIRIRNLENQK